jgi:tRNA A-37 threonylcarbamoyl transferase component Bud32
MAEDGITIDLAIPRTTASQSPPDLGVGRVLRDRYLIEGRMGSGGMGTVYKAVDKVRREHAQADAHVAVKVLHAEAHRQPSVLAKLRNEFYCAQALSHPNIVKVYEFERGSDIAFFTMELLDGEVLSAMMKRRQPKAIARPQAWNIIRQIGAGIDHAHSRNVIHADLKPQNIMVSKKDDVRILDFGASSGLADQAGANSVTPAYSSCQLLEGEQPDPRDDIFAIACIAYELLTGKHPFQTLRATEARDQGMTPREPKDLSARQWQALQQGLAWDRDDRPDSIHAWLNELILSSGAAQPNARDSDLEDEPARQGGMSAKKWIAVLAVPALLLVAWLIVHAFSGANSLGVAPPLAVAAESPPPIATPAEADLKAIEATIPDTDEAPPVAAPVAKIKRAPSLPKTPQIEKIAFDSTAYTLAHSAKFVEIHVHRSAAQLDKTNFVWWTEAGSAAEGNDFVAQGRTTAYFAPNNHLATLFIKLVPGVKRKKPQVFYVVISEPSTGAAIGDIPRAAVKLLPP